MRESAGMQRPPAPPSPADQPEDGLARQYAKASATLTLVSVGIFCSVWAVMWGPVYLRLPVPSTLYLWPIMLLLLFPVGILAILALCYGGAAARRYGARKPRYLGWSLVGASAMLMLPLPALWFGNAPLLLFGVTP